MRTKTIKAWALIRPYRLKGKWQGQAAFLCRTKKEAEEARSPSEKVVPITINLTPK